MRTELGKTIGDVEYEDDKRPVRRSFNLKVAEQRIGAEEVKCFVYDVVLRWVAFQKSEYEIVLRLGEYQWVLARGFVSGTVGRLDCLLDVHQALHSMSSDTPVQ